MKKMKKKIMLMLLVCIILLSGVCLIPFQTCLVILQDKSEEIIAYTQLEQGQQYQIEYIHSIHLSKVVETYESTADRNIRQVEISFEDFAVGMPSSAEEGEQFVNENGRYKIKNMNRLFPEIVLLTGKVVANHTLIIRNKRTPLATIIEPGSVVAFKIQKLSLWDKWKGGVHL